MCWAAAIPIIASIAGSLISNMMNKPKEQQQQQTVAQASPTTAQDDVYAQRAREDERRRMAALSQGNKSTQLTGPGGIAGAASTGIKSALGA